MSMAGRSVIDKVVVLLFPISAFIAAGFEHSVANLYFVAMALLLEGGADAAPAAVMVTGMARNLAAIVLGNAVGGGVLVGLVYYLIYVRGLASGRRS